MLSSRSFDSGKKNLSNEGSPAGQRVWPGAGPVSLYSSNTTDNTHIYSIKDACAQNKCRVKYKY